MPGAAPPRHAPARLAGSRVLRLQSDERLVALTRDGNEHAFEAIVRRYRRPLLAYSTRILGPSRAEDAVQQVLMRAHRALMAGDTEIELRPWLYRIAHNTTLNVLRDSVWEYDELNLEHDGVETPEHVALRRERFREVLAAVRSLPERQRQSILLREMEGRSHDEIAAELGITRSAARQLVSRARERVRAGITSVTPIGLLGMPSASEPVAGRTTELVAGAAGAGAGAVAAKIGAAVMVTGAIAGGVAVAPIGDGTGPAGTGPQDRAIVPDRPRPPAPTSIAAGAGVGGARAAGSSDVAAGGGPGLDPVGFTTPKPPAGAGDDNRERGERDRRRDRDRDHDGERGRRGDRDRDRGGSDRGRGHDRRSDRDPGNRGADDRPGGGRRERGHVHPDTPGRRDGGGFGPGADERSDGGGHGPGGGARFDGDGSGNRGPGGGGHDSGGATGGGGSGPRELRGGATGRSGDDRPSSGERRSGGHAMPIADRRGGD